MNFRESHLKKHFKKEQKWGYAADECFVMLEETTQETNAASHKRALVGSWIMIISCFVPATKGVLWRWLFQGRHQSFLIASGLFTDLVLHVFFSLGQARH